jgi:UDP-glucuronate decarboxylase
VESLVNIIEEDVEYISKSVNFKPLKNRSVLIIGSSGFLGFNFIKTLESIEQQNVTTLIDINPNLFPKGDFNCIEADVTKLHEFPPNIDYIIYIASNASPISYRKKPIETANINVVGLQNVLEFYKDKPIKSFLYPSTSEVYGNPDIIPTPETYNGNCPMHGPRACYAESKRYAETLCYMYHKIYDMPIKIVRPFNNYGPGLSTSDCRLPSDLANAIVADKDIVLYSDGSITRSFCYVADAMMGYWKALFYPKFDVFNIGNDYPEIQVKELASVYKNVGKDLFNYNGNIIYEPSKDSEYLIDVPARRRPDISKARKLLQYNPKVSLTDGTSKYLLHLKGEQK